MKGKIFSQTGATQTLPLVRRIIVDIKGCTKLIDRHERRLGRSEGVAAQKMSPAEVTAVNEKIASLRERVRLCLAELEELGWFLVDARDGVAHCYGEINSEIVYLSWRLGEPAVSYFHPTDKTHLDRREIGGEEKVAETAR